MEPRHRTPPKGNDTGPRNRFGGEGLLERAGSDKRSQFCVVDEGYDPAAMNGITAEEKKREADKLLSKLERLGVSMSQMLLRFAIIKLDRAYEKALDRIAALIDPRSK
jgi:hypothetical protein